MIREQRFQEAAARGECVNVSDLMRLHGRATWPALLLVLAVLCALPLVGVGTVLSLSLFALATRWPKRGGQMLDADATALPRKLLDFRLSHIWSHRCLCLFAALYKNSRWLLRRRWVALRHPRTFVGWRVWIASMALLIFIPLPLGNLLPSLSLVLLSLGWIYKDGLALMLSALAGTAAWGYGALSAGLLWSLLKQAI